MPSWSAAACFRSLRNSGDGIYSRNDSNFSESDDKRRSFISEEKRGISFVELTKKEGTTLGLTISGGIDKESRPRISGLRPGSTAHRCDCLAVGDYILSVNGIRTSKLKHDEIVTLLRNAGDKVTLEVEYEIPISPSEGSLCVRPNIIQVKLEKENDSFGFTLRGGTCSDKIKSRPLTITHVRFGGPADREGSIKTGDRLLAVDGINLSGATLQEALVVLKQVTCTAVLTVEYDVSVRDEVKNASGALLVEIDKTPGSQLGINLSCLTIPEPAIVIGSIRQASIAERSGALHVGDRVLAIDGVKVDLMTAAEAMQLLKSATGETVKLEILPFNQISVRRVPETNIRRGLTIPHYMAARASFSNSCYNTLTSLGGMSIGSNSPFISSTPPLTSKEKRKNFNNFACGETCVLPGSSNASISSTVNSAFPSIGHADVTEVTLAMDHRGYGFSIQSSTFSSDILTSSPFINSIESGSPAEKSGVLQVGDRILAVNGESTEGLTLDEVMQLIIHSHPKLVLITEFDVAESVIPSSGIFMVKLAKRGPGLGITVIAPKSRQLGDPLIISDVKKGSVAHRTGTIQPGDKLLAVDSIRMENCTAEDASEILYSCNDVVTLRIRKDDTFLDDPDTTACIIYTVELARLGGPLGITVSGTDEPFDPIFISGLTENGLAERTGALHVGDRILAINGISLRGKPLSAAVEILQTCGDTVTLKISRCPCPEKSNDGKELKCAQCVPESNAKTFTTPLPSVDSAVESLDSCTLDTLCNAGKTERKTCGLSSSRNSLPSVVMNSYHPSASSADLSFYQCSKDLKPYNVYRSNSFAGSKSMSLEDGKENWSDILEDLQTCGQSQLIRQIERSLSVLNESTSEPAINSKSHAPSANHTKCPSDTLSEESLQVLNTEIEQLVNTFQEKESDDISCLSVQIQVDNIGESLNQHGSDSCESDNYRRESTAFSMPVPIELHKVTLFKDQVYEDFGFSLSDGLYDHGVYINRIRAGGPADLSGLIKPYDRILQVNDVKTSDYDCCLTVPLIAASGDRIELLISRPAYDAISSSESTLGRASGHHPWVEDVDQGFVSPLCHFSETQTLTKTL